MTDQPNKKIRILPKGPYLVPAGVPLKQNIINPDQSGHSKNWKEGKTYDTSGKPYSLCRCGHSENKPFCDGKHAQANFDGTEKADNVLYKEAAKCYEGEKVNLLDRESLCAVARFCDRGETVWNLAEKGDEASVNLAIEEACACPAGRLTITDKQGNAVEPDLPREIGVVEDPAKNIKGPLWVKGGIELEGQIKYETRNRMALCRCGESKNMPFCDASHFRCKHMKGLDKA